MIRNILKREETTVKGNAVIKANIAVIPNQGHIITASENYDGFMNNDEEYSSINTYAKKHGISGPDGLLCRSIHNTFGEEFIKPEKKFIQIDLWIVNSRDEPKYYSITNHGFIEPIVANWNLKHNFHDKMRDESYNLEYPDGDILRISHWWPEEYISGLKEGDKIYFSFLDKNDEKIYLECTVNQNESRYSSKTKSFDELVEICLENSCRCAGCHPSKE